MSPPSETLVKTTFPGLMNEKAAYNHSRSLAKVITRNDAVSEGVHDLRMQLHELFILWRSEFIFYYTQESVSKLYKLICGLTIKSIDLPPLTKHLKRHMAICNENPDERKTFLLIPTILLGDLKGFLRTTEYDAVLRALLDLDYRNPSWVAEFVLLSRSTRFVMHFSYDSLRERHSVARASQLFYCAFRIQCSLNKSVVLLAYIYNFESINAFHKVLCETIPSDENLEELESYFRSVNEMFMRNKDYARTVKLDPLMPFKDPKLRSIYGEEGYSKTVGFELNMSDIGILGQIPREAKSDMDSKVLFHSITFLKNHQYESLSKALGDTKARDTYAHAFEIQCALNEIAFDLSRHIPLEWVQKLHETVCSVKVKPNEINVFSGHVQELRDKWAEDGLFRSKVILDPMRVFREPNIARFYGPEAIQDMEEHWDEFWPWWVKIKLEMISSITISSLALTLICIGYFHFSPATAIVSVALLFMLVGFELRYGPLCSLYYSCLALPRRSFLRTLKPERY